MAAPLDSRQIRAFKTLAETGSFTGAARQLHVSQSAVSHAMKALEQDVGCLLLHRTGKKTHLTQAGEHLLIRVERILDEMESARGELKALGQWGSGRLRIGASVSTCQYLLPAVLREFKKCFPRCVLTIQPGDTPATVEMLHANQIDLAVAMEPRHGEQLEFTHLFTDELCCLVGPLHPWAKAGKVDRKKIVAQQFILYSKTSYTFQIVQEYFTREEIVLPPPMELGSIEAIKELVKIGLGISVIAPWVAAKELRDGSLVALPLGRRKLTRRWGIFYARGRRLNLTEETFIGICRSATENIALAR